MIRADFFAPYLKSDKEPGFGYVGWDIYQSEDYAISEAKRLHVILKERIVCKVINL